MNKNLYAVTFAVFVKMGNFGEHYVAMFEVSSKSKLMMAQWYITKFIAIKEWWS